MVGSTPGEPPTLDPELGVTLSQPVPELAVNDQSIRVPPEALLMIPKVCGGTDAPLSTPTKDNPVWLINRCCVSEVTTAVIGIFKLGCVLLALSIVSVP